MHAAGGKCRPINASYRRQRPLQLFPSVRRPRCGAASRANSLPLLIIHAVYFDAQLDMLQQLQPLVVGHFDLIRLKSDDMERSFTSWSGVWSKVLRNLDFIASYGGMLEVNSAALRKGMSEPYPKAEICQVSHLRSS